VPEDQISGGVFRGNVALYCLVEIFDAEGIAVRVSRPAAHVHEPVAAAAEERSQPKDNKSSTEDLEFKHRHSPCRRGD
jgi:hypothetical protein